MDEQSERESIQKAGMRLCEYLARVRATSISEEKTEAEKEAHINRSVFQLNQIFTLNGFIMAVTERYIHLFQEPEKAQRISTEGLRELRQFLKEFTDLLAEEYNWIK